MAPFHGTEGMRPTHRWGHRVWSVQCWDIIDLFRPQQFQLRQVSSYRGRPPRASPPGDSERDIPAHQIKSLGTYPKLPKCQFLLHHDWWHAMQFARFGTLGTWNLGAASKLLVDAGLGRRHLSEVPCTVRWLPVVLGSHQLLSTSKFRECGSVCTSGFTHDTLSALLVNGTAQGNHSGYKLALSNSSGVPCPLVRVRHQLQG